MSQTAVHNPEIAQPYELSALDRCDSCGAQAYIRASVHGTVLLFCAHHGMKHKAKLMEIADEWHDESERLLQS